MPSTLTSLDSSGSRAQAGSPTIAARCTTASAPVERALAGLGVADVAALSSTPSDVEPRGHVLLAVQQHVEHAHLVPGVEQLVDQQRADVAGAAGDQ